MVILWTVRITSSEYLLLQEGKTLEKLVQDGLLIIEQDPEGTGFTGRADVYEGRVAFSIKFLTKEEAGLRF